MQLRRTCASGVVLTMATLQMACATRPTAAPSPLPDQVLLVFAGAPGRVTDVENVSTSRTRTYVAGQLLRDRTESIEFTARTKVTHVDSDGLTASEVTTLERRGVGNLNDLAFPEPGERIEYLTRPNGEVVRAGAHSPDSLYFIPTLPLPKGAVRVGDTWAMDHEWTSARGRIPLRLEITGILKDIVPCEARRICADIEVSGSVRVLARPDQPGARFTSRIRGRALFAVERGDVLWSEMRSVEELRAGPERTSIQSCMLSQTKSGRAMAKPFCEPGDHPIQVPSI